MNHIQWYHLLPSTDVQRNTNWIKNPHEEVEIMQPRLLSGGTSKKHSQNKISSRQLLGWNKYITYKLYALHVVCNEFLRKNNFIDL